MNEDDIREQQIERYVHGRMNESERSQFEQLMEHDKSLRSHVKDELVFLSLYDKDLISFKKKMDQIQSGEISISPKNENDDAGVASSPQVEPGQVIRMKYVWAAAASVALLFGAFWFFNRAPDMQQLAMNAAKNDFGNVRGEDNQFDGLFVRGEYEQFINRCTAKDVNVKDSSADLKIIFVRALLLTHRSDEALNFLNGLPANEKDDCRLQYLNSLCNIELGKKEDAIALLNSLVKEQCYPMDKPASELLHKLK